MSSAHLLCVVAHPDDESFGLGSLLAAAAAGDARVTVVCATLGESGDDASGQGRTGKALASVRRAELEAAAQTLGVARVEVLGFADSGWDGPPPPGALVDAGDAAVAATADAIERHRPDVVVTLDPSGSDGHRDHAAIGRAATDAFHRIGTRASLYHWCLTRSLMDRWVAERGRDAGVYDNRLGRPDDEITTVLRNEHVLSTRRRAIGAHATQASPFAGLTAALEHDFLALDQLVRVVPAWDGGVRESALLGL